MAKVKISIMDVMSPHKHRWYILRYANGKYVETGGFSSMPRLKEWVKQNKHELVK